MDTSSQSGSTSSSDFVRKLYKMLEDPSYESVVRWSNEGDSFVVLENEKFTKSILPKHFKHSNFASFVRQLNKYDFHKVRHSNEDGGPSLYGASAWEFKHPDFKMNNKDALDNIRRKAPVPRKPNQPSEELVPTQQMDLVNTQLVATQQQLQQLQERYSELSMHHSMLLQEVIGLQKTVVNHEHVIQDVMSFLHSVDAQRRRDSRAGNPFAQGLPTSGLNGQPTTETMSSLDDDVPASPLQHADKLLNEVNADTILNSRNLEQMTEVSMRMNGNMTTPPPGAGPRNAARSTSRDNSTSVVRYGDLDNVVYPIGQSNGIDPMFSEHIHNIPYPMPQKTADAVEAPTADARKKTGFDPGWMRQPHILLVEDDRTCRRIGGKFLFTFDCNVDNAFDGLQAVNKMNAGAKYDLILMDIIMPNLDGVSACHLIRQFDSTPIIAMTSNIRSDDIAMYFQHGMNDVLPKPFTKEGLFTMLEKHLGHLKKTQSGPDPMNPSTGSLGSMTYSRQSVKDEESPAASPATMASTWHSPSVSHLGPGTVGVSPAPSSINNEDYRGFGVDTAMTAQHAHNVMQYAATSPQQSSVIGKQAGQTPQRRPISDITGGEDYVSASGKRQQLYAQQSGIGSMQAPRS